MKTTLNLPPFNPVTGFIAVLLFIAAAVLCTSCEKSEVAPIDTATPISIGARVDVPVNLPVVGGKE